MVGVNIKAEVIRGIESFQLNVNDAVGDRCDYGLLARCTDPRTGEKYVAYCEGPDEAPEVFCDQPLQGVSVIDDVFEDDPEPETEDGLEGDEIPEDEEDEDPESAA